MGGVDHVNHGDHSGHMDHMNHGDHSGHMDHMNHGDHSGHMDHMNHGDHSGHDMAQAVLNTTIRAVTEAIDAGVKMVASSDMVDHSGHTGHEGHDMHEGHNMHSGHSGHAGHSMDGMGDGDGMDMGHSMSMSFHFGYTETILFDWWSIDSIGGLIGSLIGIFILAMLYEGLKYWREHLFRQAVTSSQYCANLPKTNLTEDNKQNAYMEQIIMPPTMSMLSKDHGIQTLLHMLQIVVSYFLMLIFMTYNVWLCLAIVLGAGLGYFLFGWRKNVVVDITEHCH